MGKERRMKMETLTKENFWDEMSQKYPKAMKHFGEWIDQYKSEHDWDELFRGNKVFGEHTYYRSKPSPKYHELPIAMQFGIFIEWANTTTKELFPGGGLIDHSERPRLSISSMLKGFEPWFEKGILP